MSLSDRLIPSSKKDPCSKCGNETGKCRRTSSYLDKHVPGTSRDIGEVPAILCMEHDAPKNVVDGDWVSTGRTKDDLWCRYLYLTPDLIAWRDRWNNADVYTLTDQEIAAREKRQRKLNEQRERDKAEREGRSLSREDRHKWNSQIINELPIGEDLLEEYRNRKFSEEEIQHSGFRSIGEWQRLQQPIDPLLPGAQANGKGLIVSGSGYLLPMKDPQGLIIGCQVRLKEASETGRYRYLSSTRQTLALPKINENPIAYFRPSSGKPRMLALVEGAGFKPYLTSERMQAITIGSPGGLFASSPKLTEEFVNAAVKELGEKPEFIVIYPDAGDTNNKSVVVRWKRVVELLQSLGHQCRFGWWSQISKNSNDIDELPEEQRQAINFILPEEFFAICDACSKDKDKEQKAQQKLKEQEQHFLKCKAIRDKLTTIILKPDKIVDVATLEGILPALIDKGAINVVSSQAGTGKTRGSQPLVDDADAVSSWHNRNALAQSVAAQYGICFKNDRPNGSTTGSGQAAIKKMAACSPSQISYNPSHLRNNGLLLIDEIDQVLNFNFSEICNQNGIRPLVLSTLEDQLSASLYGGLTLVMSADVGMKEINYLRAIAPDGTKINYIKNEYKVPKGTVYLDTSGDPAKIVDILLSKLDAGENVFLLDDCKNGFRGVKSVAEYIRCQRPELKDLILEIHSDNSDDPRVNAFRINPDEESKKYKLICCSPSIVSGINIVNGLFADNVFAIVQGILNDREIKQFINRIRGAKSIYMWVAEQGFGTPGIPSDAITPEQVKDFYQRNYEQNAKHIKSLKPDYNPIKDEWESPHFLLYCQNIAFHQCTMQFLRRFTEEHLLEEGYTIQDIDECGEIDPMVPPNPEEIQNELKFGWGRIELAEAMAIDAARFLSDEEMDQLSNNTESIPSLLLPAYEKTKLRRYFGDELVQATVFHHKASDTELTGYAAMALKNSDKKYASALENFWLLSQDVEESVNKDYSYEFKQLKHGERFAGDIRWNSRRRKCREWLGIKDFLEPDKWFTPEEYWLIGQKAKSKAEDIKLTFDFSVANVGETQVFTELMKRIGLDLKSKSIPGSKNKLKCISDESWNYCQLFVKHKLAQKAELEAKKAEKAESRAFEALLNCRTAQDYELAIAPLTEEQINKLWEKLPERKKELINSFYVKQEEPLSEEDQLRLLMLSEWLPDCYEDEEMVLQLIGEIRGRIVEHAIASLERRIQDKLLGYNGVKTILESR